MAIRRSGNREKRVLVIPCLFVVYRWTAHPNFAPVVQSPNTHTPQYVSLSLFHLREFPCVFVALAREENEEPLESSREKRETAVGRDTERGRALKTDGSYTDVWRES